jgi:ribonuclease BN (tRNA processing enzyme)
MTDGLSNIYIDFPYKSGAHNYMEYDQSEIKNVKPNATFIFTHKHSDHYSKSLLKKMTGEKYGPWNIDEIKNIEKSIPDFSIESFKTPHKVFGISFEHYSYLITWHNKKIFISGDTENADTIASQENLDLAFIPAWLATDAKEKGIKLGPISKMYAIYHIGPKDHITNDGNDPQIKLLDKQGETILFPF